MTTTSPSLRSRGPTLARFALFAASAALASALALPSRSSAQAEAAAPHGEPGATFAAADVRFFEERIRPVLVDKCYRCHGPEAKRIKGGLRFGSFAALQQGGDSGPAVVPGDPDSSRLIQALRWSDSDLEMPPDGRLEDEDRLAFEEWVRRGAAWPDYGPDDRTGTEPGETQPDEGGIDYAAGRDWWSLQPIVKPQLPELTGAYAEPALVQEPLDAFVLARLAEQGLEPNPRASDAELVRRAYVDLIGIPPTFAEIEAYRSDPRPARWALLVERLLARPEYGERWASFWLDLVRFAQTNGYERDTAKPLAWRYRNWVINALNADLPYDEFLRHQLAGDELDRITPESLIATGFYRVGPWDDEPNDPEQALYDELDDFVRVVGEGFLGLTVGCARCHDHKFDPIAQDDYTGMVAFFKNVEPYGNPRFARDSNTLRILDRTRPKMQAWEAQRQAREKQLRRALSQKLALGRRRAAGAGGSESVSKNEALHALEKPDLQAVLRIQTELSTLSDSFEGELAWALAVREKSAELEPTPLLVRGNATSPADLVPAHFLRVLEPADEALAKPTAVGPSPQNRLALPSSGARRALADWITAPENPLTARVIVNRIWQQHFGRGIVASPNDLGRSGLAPTHPLLLDHLAATFVTDGWSLKRLHRRILNSSTWQRSSRATNSSALQADPANELLWRQNVRRLEAEALHDALLAASGELQPVQRTQRLRDAKDPSFFPLLSAQALAGMSRPASGWGVSSSSERAQRAVYAYIKRGMLPPFFTTFDFGNATLPIGQRLGTNLATQTMTLLNGEFANRRAASLTARVLNELGLGKDSSAAQLEDAALVRAWELTLLRRPSAAELELAREYLAATTSDLERAPARLVFSLRVPERIDFGFLDSVRGQDLWSGPERDWRFLAGHWGDNYNGTVAADAQRGPLALFEPAVFATASAELELHFGVGLERATVALGVQPGAKSPETWNGLQLVFEPDESVCRVLAPGQSGESGEAEARVLATWEVELSDENELRIAFELTPDRLQVTLGEQITQQVTLPEPLTAGHLGVRAQGGILQLSGELTTAEGTFALRPTGRPSAAVRALESVCLMLFNFNEFLYVD